MQREDMPLTSEKRSMLVTGLVLLGLIVWAYWPVFSEMAEKWSTDPQYSHGYLVPLFAIGLAYWRRHNLKLDQCRMDWRGLILLTPGIVLFLAGGFFYFDFAAAISLILTLAGAVLIVAGPVALRWSLPMVGFLAFMVPLPFAVEMALSHPLRRIATQGSTWILQTIGFPAVSEGNTILLEHGRIAVVEACSGLSMLLTFAAMTTAVAMVVTRPLLDRAIVLLSTVPVAVAVNIARISLNGIAIEIWGSEVANKWFHDQGGWMMMPMALALLGLELWVLGRLLVAPKPKAAIPLPTRPTSGQRPPVAAAR